jgi:hypothetical protein
MGLKDLNLLVALKSSFELAQRRSRSLLRSQSRAGVSPPIPRGDPEPPVERTGVLTVEF